MRILMSTDTVGGVWQYALELARGLIQAGDQVVLASLGGRPSPAQTAAVAEIPGLEFHVGDFPLEWMDKPWQRLAQASEWLAELNARRRPDLVHLNHLANGDVDWGVPVLRVVHSCVYSWHQAVRGRPPEPMRWQRYRDEVRQSLWSAQRVVAPSLAMLYEAERYYGPFRHAQVIYNGRAAADFPPAAKQPYLLSVGRLWDEAKNVMALARVAADLPWSLKVAGEIRHPDGGEAELLGVELLGRLGPGAASSAYAHAGIYALPARYEPFGLSALEAALARCPLVLGDIPSLRELWDGAALFVPPDDRQALTETLRWLIEDPELRQVYAQRAQDRAREYSAQRMVGAYRELYTQLVDEAQGRRRYAHGR